MDRKYAKIKLKCFYCGTKFKVYPSEVKDNRRFCSKRCGYNSRKSESQKLYKCDWCKMKFTAYKSMVKGNKHCYCSIECSKNDAKRRAVFPENHGMKISLGKQKFSISKEFLLKNYINKNRTTLQSVADLVGCKTCTIRKWLKKHNLRAKHDYTFTPNYNTPAEELKKYSEMAKRFYGRECMICGYNKFVSTHTIIRRSKGGKRILENLIVVCPNHHMECEYGVISIDEQKEIIKNFVKYKEKVRYSK